MMEIIEEVINELNIYIKKIKNDENLNGDEKIEKMIYATQALIELIKTKACVESLDRYKASGPTFLHY